MHRLQASCGPSHAVRCRMRTVLAQALHGRIADPAMRSVSMAKPVLTISSKNYGAWSLRGWLMCRLAGLDFSEKVIPPDDPAMKAEMLLLSSSMLVPSLQHGNVKVWDTLAIAEYLNEIKPKAGLLPA